MCEGFSWNAITTFYSLSLLFNVFCSPPLTLRTPQRTRRRKLNAVFQSGNLSSAEERVCGILSHSASPWGDTNFFFSSLPLAHLSGWIVMMARRLHRELCQAHEKERMLTPDRL